MIACLREANLVLEHPIARRMEVMSPTVGYGRRTAILTMVPLTIE
jgi:hypothetical protein